MAERLNAHTEEPAHKGTFPPFDTQTFPSQLFWLAVTFVALYLIMARVALPRIRAISTRRSIRRRALNMSVLVATGVPDRVMLL